MMQTYTRAKLSWDDLQFVVNALCRPGERETTLLKLLADEEMRDAMLEHPRVLTCLQDTTQTLAVTPFLYFYLLVRRALQDFEIDDRVVTEYLANLLVEFGHGRRAYRPHAQTEKEYHYLVDLLRDLLVAGKAETFYLRSHLGNYALFLTGLYPARVYYRAKYRAPAPDFSYYETLGSKSYRLAAQHDYAIRHGLHDTFELLGRRFKRVRAALNHAAENYMCLDRNIAGRDGVLRRVDNFIAEQLGAGKDQTAWED